MSTTDGSSNDGATNDGRNAPDSTQAPSLLKQFFDLGTTALSFPFKHPGEALRMVGSNVQQFGAKLAGSEFKPDRDIGSQEGRVIFVTGGNTGLGKQAILQLAKHNPARIYLASRSEKKGKDALESIQAALKDQDLSDVDIQYIQLDLASFKSIRAAASQFASECDRLDTLILNAGVMALPPGKTEDGFEIQFGTNHVGHFLLTKLLLPTLRRTADAPGSDVRVVSVSSMAWQMSPYSVSTALSLMTSTEALCAQNTWTCYGVSKAANILFATELARRYPEITAVSIHPGVILTGLYAVYNSINPVVKLGLQLVSPFITSEENGVLNHLWAAGIAKEKLTSGEYYTPVGVMSGRNPFVDDAEACKKLWEWTDEQVSRLE